MHTGPGDDNAWMLNVTRCDEVLHNHDAIMMTDARSCTIRYSKAEAEQAAKEKIDKIMGTGYAKSHGITPKAYDESWLYGTKRDECIRTWKVTHTTKFLSKTSTFLSLCQTSQVR